MYGWMDDGCMGGWIDRLLDWMGRWIDGLMDGWMDWMGRWTDGGVIRLDR